MAFDAHKNLAIAAVATAPSPAPSGVSLTVGAGEGARFPVPPFNATVWPATALPTPVNAEVVRVTALAGDTFTLTRAQEGTTARAILPGDLIAATITAKTITDVEAALVPLDNAGVWVDVPYNPANYKTVAGATWTVEAADVLSHAYARINKMLWLNLVINTSSLSASDVCQVAFPAGFVPLKSSVVLYRVYDGTEKLGLSYNNLTPPYVVNLTTTGAPLAAGVNTLNLQLMALYVIQ